MNCVLLIIPLQISDNSFENSDAFTLLLMIILSNKKLNVQSKHVGVSVVYTDARVIFYEKNFCLNFLKVLTFLIISTIYRM